jgi:hypothetical protein
MVGSKTADEGREMRIVGRAISRVSSAPPTTSRHRRERQLEQPGLTNQGRVEGVVNPFSDLIIFVPTLRVASVASTK